MKTTFTVENEFNFLSDHVPGSVYSDNDLKRLPLQIMKFYFWRKST